MIRDDALIEEVGQGVRASLRRVLPIVGHLPFASVPDRAGPGEGAVNQRAAFRAIDELGYARWVGAETAPRAGTDGGPGWLAGGVKRA